MTRVLLADDSPHAQRMGERILRDEGYEVISVSDGRAAMLRLADAAPDVIIADISMPEVSGYQLCEYVKAHGGAPVFLTAGAVEPYDIDEMVRVQADGILKKPFESTQLLAAISKSLAASKPLRRIKGETGTPGTVARAVAVLDPEQIRAAVTVAMDAAMPALIDTVTERVIAALSGRKTRPT